MRPCLCSETAERVRRQLPLITPSRPGEMHYKAPGTSESNMGLAGSRRENDFAEVATSLAEDSAAQLASEGQKA